MGKGSAIAWTHHTFNHVRGCKEVSPGCDNCYARVMSVRNPTLLGVWGTEQQGGQRVVASESMWRQPVRWSNDLKGTGKRERVFSASLADWAELWDGPIVNSKGERLYWSHSSDLNENAWHWIPESSRDGGEVAVDLADVRQRLFRLIDCTPNLDWLLLTKRPQNILKLWPAKRRLVSGRYQVDPIAFRPNVWLGTTIENQRAAEVRAPFLRECSEAWIRFLSVEPMLEPINLRDYLQSGSIEWVICGAEQGSNSRPLRPMQQEWAEDLLQQCRDYGIAFFMKQMEVAGKITDSLPLFSKQLQVREFPRVRIA